MVARNVGVQILPKALDEALRAHAPRAGRRRFSIWSRRCVALD